MKRPLRLLHVEDNEDDAVLILNELRRGGFEPLAERVETSDALRAALRRREWDIVVSDFALPGFTGLEALAIVKASGLDLPFILVSGTIGEDVAVGAMKDGANDYIMKNRIARLVPAVKRELADAQSRRKQAEAEEAKRESEERFRGAFNTSAIGMGIVAPNGTWIEANPSLRRILGYSEEELRGRTFQELTHPDDLAADLASSRRLLAGEIPTYQMEKRYFHKHGGVVWALLSVSLVRDAQNLPLHFVCQVQDITQRKRAERVQRAVYHIAEASSGVKSLDELFIAVHESIRDVMPADNFYIALYDEFSGLMSFPYFVDEVDVPHGPKALGRGLTEYVLRTGMPLLCTPALNDELIARGEVELVGAPSPIWLGVPLKIEARTIGVMTVQHYADERAYGEQEKVMLEYVSSQVAKAIERKRAEEAQRRSEEQFRLISENVIDMIAVLDLDGRRWYNSPSYRQLLGDPESLIGSDSFEDIVPEDRERIREIFRETVRTGIGQRAEYRLRSSDGGIHTIESQGSVIRDGQGEIVRVVMVSRDITEKRALEKQFLRAQRLESIGTLAGGIAHDLNNVLAPIMLSLDLLSRKLPDAQSQRMFQMLQATGKRGSDLIRQVLSFARGVDGERSLVQVRHLIDEVTKIVSVTFPKSISLLNDVPKNLPPISADATQIHQVLMNLCVNARDAMPSGGAIEIKAESVGIDELRALRHLDARPGPYVLISVTDQGTGIPADIQEKIFDPFFTTKEIGRGTGLGLSTVQAIVKSHEGFVSLYSEVGRGSTFKVALPAQECGDEAQREPQSRPKEGNGELILVVDDEVSIREITKLALESHGYNVLTAADGPEGISAFASATGKVALVITDMMMPHLDGASVIRIIQKMDPTVKFLAVSGLKQQTDLFQDGAVKFLQKPFSSEKLLQTIAETLSAGSS